jgi:hypothetical protein
VTAFISVESSVKKIGPKLRQKASEEGTLTRRVVPHACRAGAGMPLLIRSAMQRRGLRRLTAVSC